jgi:hypothetical protein
MLTRWNCVACLDFKLCFGLIITSCQGLFYVPLICVASLTCYSYHIVLFPFYCCTYLFVINHSMTLDCTDHLMSGPCD